MKMFWKIEGWKDKLEHWLKSHAWAQKLYDLLPHKYLRRLDYYIMAKFLGTYIFAIALIISIAVVFDFNEKMDRFMEHEAPWSAIIFDYYKNFIPYFANLFSPLFVFIAVIFFTAKMAENSEIIAMFSTGMSFKRMLRPYMVSAGIISIVTFFLGAYIIPQGSVTRINFEDKYYKERKANTARNIQMEVDTNVVAYIERYEDHTKTGYRFSLDKFDGKQLVSHMTARSIIYDTVHANHWSARDYMIRELGGEREIIKRGNRIDTVLQLTPEDLILMQHQQEMMTNPELSAYIDRQKARGLSNTKEFEIEYHKRIAMSFASFILTLIGASLSSRKMKGGMGFNLGVGMGLSFSYILFQTVSSTFSVNGAMPPIVAVWIPNILYAFIACFLYRRAPK